MVFFTVITSKLSLQNQYIFNLAGGENCDNCQPGYIHVVLLAAQQVVTNLIPVSIPGGMKRLGVLSPPPGRVASSSKDPPSRHFFCFPKISVISCFRV